MLATIADNGLYHQAHVIKYWQQSDGAEQMPRVAVQAVLNPSQDAQVQYAMEQTTINGTAAQTVTFGQQTPGTVIGKTGTTSSSHSGFFIGSTTQYTLVVGMFTVSQSNTYPNNLSMLGGGGFGGFWPAKIWNTFAEAEFSPTPTLFPTNPAFTGQTWNLLGQVTKAAKKPGCTETFNGQTVSIVMKGCPTPKSKNCTFDSKHNWVCGNGIGNGNNGNGNNGNGNNGNGNGNGNGTKPTPTATCQFQGDPTCGSGGFQSATPTPTCQFQGDPTCNGNSPNTSTPTASTTQGGLAIGGGLTALPGSLLWTTMSRRRRKKRAAAAE
jgi:membrane peptidoglycan carboxypeptidase